jgi:ectoine hydroxylase-related dioxygenase (phytanoyl-CoA dioxygenase family)
MSDLDAELESFQRDGYVIIEQALDRTDLGELATALAPHESHRPMGRTAFEGKKSQRVYSLAGKGEVFQRLAEHPRVLGLVDRLLMPNFLLSTLQSIRLHPGEAAQAWHTDDAFYFMPRPHALPLAVSVIWAIDDFTEDNGATELIPGSHRWSFEHPDQKDHEVAPAIMPAGSALVFDGALWHRGGDNRSRKPRLAISPQYCQPWLRPQESQLLIVPPDAARACSERMRTMLGYSIHPPFIGQVDGMHPLRLVDDDYRDHKTEARSIADRVLARPVAGMVKH